MLFKIFLLCVKSINHLFKAFWFLNINILSGEISFKFSKSKGRFFLLYVATYFIKVKFNRSLQPGISGRSLFNVVIILLKTPFNWEKVE